MYAKFYGLAVEPFSLSPDPRFCYRHPSFARAKAYFEFAIHRGEGFVVVTGRPGTGKTTLIQDLVRDLRKSSLLVARIDRTQVDADDLLRLVAYAFGIDARRADKASLLHDIEQLLRRRAGPRNRAILIVDEAQNLPPAALEELRLITNLHDQLVPLVQIFLVGQEDLRTSIRHPSLEQLHQRIIAACHIEPLSPAEMRGYIQHRLLCAGWQGDPAICGPALGLIHVATRGIPRLVNKFCDRLLVHGSIEGRHILTAEDAHLVLAELRQEYLNPQDAPLGDLFRKDGVPDLADLGFDPAEFPAAGPTTGSAGVTGEGPRDALPADPQVAVSGLSAVESAETPFDLRVETPEPAAPAPPARRPHRSRARWLAAAVLVLAAAVGYWLVGPQRFGDLAESARTSAEHWLSARGGAGRLFQSGTAGEPGGDGLAVGQTTAQTESPDLPSEAAPASSEDPVSPQTRERSPQENQPSRAAEQGPGEPFPVAEPEPAPERATWTALPPAEAGVSALDGDEPPPRTSPAGEVGSEPETSGAPQSDLAALGEALADLGLGVAGPEAGELRLDLVAEVPFGVDSASVPVSSIPFLTALARIVAEHPGTRVRVIGHTDGSGRPRHNQDLSLRRAEAIVAQLVGEGVAPGRLTAEGRGMDEPLLAADGTPVFLRRVELRIEAGPLEGPGTAAIAPPAPR